ncbi:MAG: hypothetical protein JKY81_01795 [Colwellia sp.]|nr:hypothetical protein [Colwellia sp.]
MNGDDPAFIQENMTAVQDPDIEELRTQVEALTASVNDAQDAASAAAAAAEEATTLLSVASNDAQLIGQRGALGDIDFAARTDMVTGTLGASGVGTKADTLWYTGGGTPTKKTNQYGTISFETEDFVVEEGALIKLEWSYTQDAVLNMFEWFMWQEVVKLKTSGGSDIATILLANEFMPATVNTNGVPGGYSGSLNLGPTHTKVKFIVVPALTGSWPSDGIVKLTCDLLPHSALTSPTDECFAGATFNAGSATIQAAFKAIDISISGEAVNSGPVTITS